MRRFALLLLLILSLSWSLPAHATTQYVNGVQNGTVTIASSSLTGTATVTAATGTFILLYDGCTTSAAASNGQAYARLSVSGTTVTATRGASSTTTVTCAFSLIDATSNLVTSVQSGTISIATSSGTSTISSVSTTAASVFIEGMSQTLTTQHFDLNTPVVTLTNATTVTGTLINGGSGTTIVGWQVVNWNPSALNQNVQQFVKTWTDTTGSTTTQAITSVNVNNAMVVFGGGGSPSGDTNVKEQPTIQLTSPTVVTITIGDSADGNTQQENFTVVEFISGVLQQSAQRGATAIAASTSATSTITSSATGTTALNWNGFLSATATNTTHATLLPSVTQTNATTITASLNASGSATSAWEALNFQNTGGGGAATQDMTFQGFP